MERLTKKDSQGYYIEDISVPYDEKRRGPAVDRLGAYEDKGVAPEDTLSALEMAKAACELTVADAYIATGLMPERVAELAQAEKDGRLVVFPEVTEADRQAFVDGLHDYFQEAAVHDPSVGIFGMRDGEAELANALMAALRKGENETMDAVEAALERVVQDGKKD